MTEMVEVHCAAMRQAGHRAVPCQRFLHEVPHSWQPQVSVLRGRVAGDHELKHCPGCGQWVAIVYKGRTAA